MTSGPHDLCVLALRDPRAAATQWSVAEWSRYVPQARSAGLLARTCQSVLAAAPTTGQTIPASLLGHLESSRRMFAAQRAEITRELGHIQHALAGLGAPVILLKGAAYLAAGLPAAEGRFFSDVDILVPKAALPEAESSLMLNGWLTTHHNAYDQRYYRQWMHELPPLQHVRRGTTLDLHHNILPATARLKPDGQRLVEAAVALPDWPGLHVLAPADMVLHSMTHLFMNDDMSHALRDLSDLDLLLRYFGTDEVFWDRLLKRAAEMDLLRPLHYGARHAKRILGTPMPPKFAECVERAGPAAPLRPLMDALWRRALRCPHPSATLPGNAAAHLALYVRGHWLRMPPGLLAKHLTIKALRLHERAPRSNTTAPAPAGG